MAPPWLHRNPAVRELLRQAFLLSGCNINSRWFRSFRKAELIRVMVLPFHADRLPERYGRWLDERVIEYPWFLSQLPERSGNLLDAGSTLNHDFILAHPKLANKNITILNLAPETENFERDGLSYHYGDLRHTDLPDNHFDFIVSISTIEHVGLNNRRFHPSAAASPAADFGPLQDAAPESFVDAVMEMRRLLKPGGPCFITVPFGKHCVRDWFQLFDGAMLNRIVGAFRPASHQILCFRYTQADGWKLSNVDAAADATYFDRDTDPPWQGRPAAAEAVACLRLVK